MKPIPKIAKPSDIQMLILDVDGTLTSGGITYGASDESKTFNVKDGLIIHAINKMGIMVIFLTGRNSGAVARRATDLGVTAIQGVSDKQAVLRKLIAKNGIKLENTGYIGDDLNDYAAMKLCGFRACPIDASEKIKEICDYVSPIPGGLGAVRDICEYILKEMGKYNELLAMYGAFIATES